MCVGRGGNIGARGTSGHQCDSNTTGYDGLTVYVTLVFWTVVYFDSAIYLSKELTHVDVIAMW